MATRVAGGERAFPGESWRWIVPIDELGNRGVAILLIVAWRGEGSLLAWLNRGSS